MGRLQCAYCNRGRDLRAKNGVASSADFVNVTSDEKRKDVEMNQNSTIEERARATKSDPRWMSIVNRDASGDGKFYYSVKTTGVYCRPSCAARLARPENVQYHRTCEDAEKAGFRPCKRCKPDQASS